MADFNKMLQKLQFQDLKIEPGLNEASFTKGETNSGYHVLELMHDLYLVTISDPGEGESSRGDIHIVTNGANLQYVVGAPSTIIVGSVIRETHGIFRYEPGTFVHSAIGFVSYDGEKTK